MNYSNWGPPGLGPSMLSHNSCYWIQSNSGLWRPGTCTNITMGVVCKLPRGERPAPLPPAPGKLAPGWGQRPDSHSVEDTVHGKAWTDRPGAAGTLPWGKRVCRKDWLFLQISKLHSRPVTCSS